MNQPHWRTSWRKSLERAPRWQTFNTPGNYSCQNNKGYLFSEQTEKVYSGVWCWKNVLLKPTHLQTVSQHYGTTIVLVSTHLFVFHQGVGDQCSGRQTSRRAAHVQKLWPSLCPKRAPICHQCHVQAPHRPTRYFKHNQLPAALILKSCIGGRVECVELTTGWRWNKLFSNPSFNSISLSQD